MQEKLESLFYSVKDYENKMMGMPVPASTTMLFEVCNNDPDRFKTACRLITLFTADAYRAGKDDTIPSLNWAVERVNELESALNRIGRVVTNEEAKHIAREALKREPA